MDDLASTVATCATVVASAAGVLVAVEQLTQRARMRRIAEWSRDLAEGEHSPNRTAALRDIRHWASGQVLATVMVPARLYLEGTLWAVLAPFALIWRPTRDVGTTASLIGFWFISLWLVLRRTIRIHLERYRVASEYFRGAQVRPPQTALLFQMEGGTRSEFLWSGLLSAGIIVSSLGVRVLLLSNSGTLGLGLIATGGALVWLGGDQLAKRTPPLLRAIGAAVGSEGSPSAATAVESAGVARESGDAVNAASVPEQTSPKQ